MVCTVVTAALLYLKLKGYRERGVAQATRAVIGGTSEKTPPVKFIQR